MFCFLRRLQDVVDPVIDEQLASFVVSSHMRSHPSNTDHELDDDDEQQEAARRRLAASMQQEQDTTLMGPGESPDAADSIAPLDQDILKKYIAYARANVKPALHDVDSEKIASLYAELRQQSAISGGVPIAVRHIESVMRMAEASARMHLRDHVREDDTDLAIKVMLESFLQAQKVSVRKSLQRNFKKYITFGEEINQLLMHQLQGLVRLQEKYQRVSEHLTLSIYIGAFTLPFWSHISTTYLLCVLSFLYCRLKLVKWDPGSKFRWRSS